MPVENLSHNMPGYVFCGGGGPNNVIRPVNPLNGADQLFTIPAPPIPPLVWDTFSPPPVVPVTVPPVVPPPPTAPPPYTPPPIYNPPPVTTETPEPDPGTLFVIGFLVMLFVPQVLRGKGKRRT